MTIGAFFVHVCSYQVTADDASLGRVGRIRAALVYYLVKFIDWPETLSDSALKKELVICLLGQDPLNDYLDETINGKRVKGLNLSIKELDEDEQPTSCDLVFVTKDKRASLSRFTVGHSPNLPFIVCAVDHPEWGECMIQLYEKGNRIRIAIDPDLAKRANYNISSELLDVSDLKDEKK